MVLASRHSFICAGGLLRPRAPLRGATYPMCCGRAAPHPTLSCTELGLHCPSGLLRRRWSLTPPFHPYRLRGGMFSVALSIRLRFPLPSRPFKRSSALWCPDFPLGEPSECLLRDCLEKLSQTQNNNQANSGGNEDNRQPVRRENLPSTAIERRQAHSNIPKKGGHKKGAVKPRLFVSELSSTSKHYALKAEPSTFSTLCI